MNTRIPLDHLSKGGLLRQLPDVISGHEGEQEEEQETDPPKPPAPKPAPPTKTAPKPNEEEDEEDEDEEDDKADKRDTKGLLAALAAERQAHKVAERERKKLQKEKDEKDLSEKTDIEQAQIKEKTASEKVQKLAAGLLKRDIDKAIKDEAEKLKFLDPNDAIDLIDRSKLVYEQDDDDPSKVTIDLAIVKAQVKDLATRKPHFLSKGTNDGEPTGGGFGGSKNQNGKKSDDDILKERYPNQFS